MANIGHADGYAENRSPLNIEQEEKSPGTGAAEHESCGTIMIRAGIICIAAAVALFISYQCYNFRVIINRVINSGTKVNKPEFQIYAAHLSNFNLSKSQITSNWNISLISRHPKYGSGFYYKSMNISVLYKGTLVSSRLVQSQVAFNQTILDVSIGNLSMEIDGGLADLIVKDKESNHSLSFNLEIRGAITNEGRSDLFLGLMPWWPSSYSFYLSCGSLKLQFWSDDIAEMISRGPIQCNSVCII